jgi:hypothetical protein
MRGNIVMPPSVADDARPILGDGIAGRLVLLRGCKSSGNTAYDNAVGVRSWPQRYRYRRCSVFNNS